MFSVKCLLFNTIMINYSEMYDIEITTNHLYGMLSVKATFFNLVIPILISMIYLIVVAIHYTPHRICCINIPLFQ